MGFRILLIVLFLVCLNGAAEAREIPKSCPEAPADPMSSKALAKVWFSKGEAAVQKELYGEALDSFRCSLRMFEHPSTAYNAALAAQQVGELHLALQLARRCLELDTEKPELAKSLIEALVPLIEEQATPNDSEQESETETVAATEPVPNVELETARLGEDGPSSRLVSFGYVALGLGVAAVLTGAITGAVALSMDSDLSTECDDGHCTIDSASRIEKMNNLGTSSTVLLSLGGVAAATGVMMLVMGHRRREAGGNDFGLAAVAGPALVGAALSGRF